MAGNQVSQPNYAAPFVDDNGILTRSWAIWIRDLHAFVKAGAADEDILGLVKQMPLVTDAPVAPASYNQAHIQSLVDTVNELIANSKAAGQMNDA